MSPLNAAVSVLPESNHSQNCLHHRWYKFPLCALFLMLALLVSRAAYATTYTVTDLTDSASDTGSLRYAVNTAANGDTINFAPNLIGTITLTNGTLLINTDVTIAGPGPALLTISGNNAAAVFTIYATGTVNISGLAFANGNNSNNGGGIAHIAPGTWTVSYCAFYNNATGAGGAGIANGGALTLENSTFYGNTGALGGGGLFNNAGTATVENSTFFGNSSPGGPGGGIYNNGTMTVSNSTITGNADSGIFNNGGQTITVSNSIVAGNTNGDCNQCGTQSANNLISGTTDLGPLQYNGGDTETMMPLPGSAVIGAGLGSTLATDQRGFVRSTSGASDLGAVQTNYLTVTNLNDSGAGSLRGAVTAANSAGSGDIVFQSGLTGTIPLSSSLPSITADTNLIGPGANLLTISGSQTVPGNFDIVDVPNAGTAVNISGVTIANGNALSGPGGISNSGRMSVENSFFSYNTGNNGGAIFNNGVLGVENSTFSNNSATDGGGIDNSGSLVAANSTFTGNRDYNGNGGGIENTGGAIVYNSTITGNNSLNGGVGAGMDSNSGSLAVTNNIVAANINLNGNTEDDCHNCTQNGPMLTGANPGLGALAYNGVGATVQTMLPLPGSPAIQAGDPTRLPAGLTDDQRGFPRLTGGKLDLGAAQTNYTSVQFVQQPTNTIFNTDINPAVTLEMLETNPNLTSPNNTDAVDGIPITLTFNGTGTLGGTLTQTTSGGVASFGDLKVGSTVGTGNTLATTLTVTPTGVTPPLTLSATSNPFNITLEPSTVSFNPALPASVTYGVAPLTLKANAYSGGTPTGQILSFQVDSGPATVSGNVLTITGGGTVVVEVDAAANATYAASDATASIAVAPAVSSLALAASSNQATPGTSVTLTATAASATPGTTATPTGTVTFMANGNSIGTAQLTGGVATLALTTLPGGSNTITASYPGDTNFLGSTAQLAAPIAIGTPTFTMTSSVSSLSIQPGQSGTVTLTLTPSYGYTGTVNFNCSGLPAHSTCSFSPSSATLNSSASPVTVTLTVATSVTGQARSSIARLTPLRQLRSLPILPAMFFWLPGSGLALEEGERNKQSRVKKMSSRMLLAALLLALGVGMLSLAGCSGMSANYNTPASSQTVTITATGSGNVSQSIAVQVNIS